MQSRTTVPQHHLLPVELKLLGLRKSITISDRDKSVVGLKSAGRDDFALDYT